MSNGTPYDLIVYDSNVISLGEEYISRAQAFETVLEKYINILQAILDEGIKEGKVHDNLAVFLKMVNELKAEAINIANSAKGSSQEFLTDMDSADSYLY